MLVEKQKAFRQNYRSRIAGWYNGIIHVAVIYIIGITAMWIYIQHIDNGYYFQPFKRYRITYYAEPNNEGSFAVYKRIESYIKRYGNDCSFSMATLGSPISMSVSYTHLLAHETREDLVFRLLL